MKENGRFNQIKKRAYTPIAGSILGGIALESIAHLTSNPRFDNSGNLFDQALVFIIVAAGGLSLHDEIKYRRQKATTVFNTSINP